MKKLWNDECGAVLSAELILLATIVVLALVVGMKEVQEAINQELEDVASAFGSVNQDFTFDGVTGCLADTAGSQYADEADQCDEDTNVNNVAAANE